MPAISNKSGGALTVPLPGGKKLRLGPGKTGQITPKALKFPPVQALLDAGEVEITSTERERTSRPGSGPTSRGPGRDPWATGGGRHTGDR